MIGIQLRPLLLLLLLLCCSCSLLFAPPEESEQELEARFKAAQSRRANLKARLTHSQRVKTGPLVEEEDGSLDRLVLRDSPEVRYHLQILTNPPHDSFIAEALPRRRQHLPTIELIFRQYGLPLELSNIALLESRFNPEAGSTVGARGLWQFMKQTARTQGLRVSLFVDERRDVRKSTFAAAEYLTELYQIFDDWLLVVAAYNVGPGAIRRAIEQGGTSDFFELCRSGYIHRDIRDFVSRFIAVSMILRNPDLYGFEGQINDVEQQFAEPGTKDPRWRARLKSDL